MIRRPIRSGRPTDVGRGTKSRRSSRAGSSWPSSRRRGAARRHDARCARAATRASTPTRRSRSTASRRRWASSARRSRPSCCCGAIAGACIAYSMIYFMNVIDCRINIGNRPPHGPPANIPITFELAVLLGGGSAFFGLLRAGEAAAAVPPGVRVGGVRARLDRRVLPVGGAAAPATDADRALADVARRGRDRRRAGRRSRSDDARCLISRSRWRWSLRRGFGLRREHPRPDGRPPAAGATATSESKFYADGLSHARAARGDGAARAHHAERAR